MEDDLKKIVQPKRIKSTNNNIFLIEDDINIFEKGRRPQFSKSKWLICQIQSVKT